jgi:hypothetical protein
MVKKQQRPAYQGPDAGIQTGERGGGFGGAINQQQAHKHQQPTAGYLEGQSAKTSLAAKS